MRRLLEIAICLMALVLAACGVRDKVLTHRLQTDYVFGSAVPHNLREYGDLDGDMVDEIVATDAATTAQTAFVVLNQTGKVLAQFNTGYMIQSLSILNDPRDNKAWIYQSFNDGEKVHLWASNYTWTPRTTREDKRFQTIPREHYEGENLSTPWVCSINPVQIVDLDGDGKLELVCIGSAGFKANPRGVIVYDLDSGNLKWYFRIPTSVSSLFVEDLDDNGSKELIFGTRAMKNSLLEINGLNDLESYLVVLNAAGEMLYRSRLMQDYSSVNLALADLEQDGLNEIYVMANSWGNQDQRNSVSLMQFRNNRMVKLREYSVASNLADVYYKNLLHKLDRDGNIRITLIDSNRDFLVLDGRLDPVKHSFKGWAREIQESVDLDNDGNKELILLTDDQQIVVLDHNLQERAKLKSPYPPGESILIRSLGKGFGQRTALLVSTSTESTILSYHYLPPDKIILALVHAYAHWLMALLPGAIIFAWWLYRKRTNLYYLVSDNVEMGQIVTDGTDKIYSINRKTEDLLSLYAPPEQVLDRKRLSHLFPELHETLERLSRSGNRVLKTRQTIAFGEHKLDCHVSYIKFTSLKTRYIITYLASVQNGDQVAKELLWADTARRLSHNVRRHITNVILALEPLEAPQISDAERIEYSRIIKEETERIRVFTHAFQRFTELKDYELKLQDIIPSVEHCLSRIKLPASLKLIKNWNLHSVEAMIEPIRFEEALSNLLINALESMQDTGILHISINKVPQHGMIDHDLSVLIEIEDNGKGIAQQNLLDIFKPFYTTKESGTGIGLPESKKIIESMQGILEIRSEQGVGTTASIWLKGE